MESIVRVVLFETWNYSPSVIVNNCHYLLESEVIQQSGKLLDIVGSTSSPTEEVFFQAEGNFGREVVFFHQFIEYDWVVNNIILTLDQNHTLLLKKDLTSIKSKHVRVISIVKESTEIVYVFSFGLKNKGSIFMFYHSDNFRTFHKVLEIDEVRRMCCIHYLTVLRIVCQNTHKFSLVCWMKR